MPFAESKVAPKIEVNPNSRPVSVIVSFKCTGEYIPLHFQVDAEDESRETYKVESIKYVKELKGRTIFCCTFQRNGRLQEILLAFYIADHVWRIES